MKIIFFIALILPLILVSGCRTCSGPQIQKQDYLYKSAKQMESEILTEKAKRRLDAQDKLLTDRGKAAAAGTNVVVTSVEPAASVKEKSAQKIREEKKPVKEARAAEKPVKVSQFSDSVWESIRKQKVDSAKAFTLVELIDLGLRNNPATRQVWESTLVAREQATQAKSTLYPQITLSQAITREKTNSPLDSHLVDNLNYGPAVQITYLLLDFGGRGAGIEQALQGILAANAKYDQSIQDLLLEVEKAYYGLYSAQSSLQAAQDDVKNTKADLDAAQLRFDVGLVTQLDVLQARSDYDNSLYSLEEAKGQINTAKANLAKSIGLPADADFQITNPIKPVPTQVNEDDVSRLIEESIQKRPDIASLRAQLKAKDAAIAAATSNLLPALNFGAEGSRQQYKFYSGDAKKALDQGYSAYLSVDWDIFDGFSLWSKRKQAKIEADMAKDKLVQSELALSAQVWTKYYDFNTAVRKLAYSEAYLDSTSTSYDLALESYNAGLKDILDLLSAQSKLSQARSRLIQSKQDVFVALAELAHATGSLDKDKERKAQADISTASLK